MKITVLHRVYLIVGIAAVSVVAGSASAQAQSPNSTSNNSAAALMPESSATPTSVAQVDGTVPTQPAPGTFEPVPGTITPTQPAPGTFEPVPGTITPTQPAPGTFEPVPGTITPTQPAPGTVPPGTTTPAPTDPIDPTTPAGFSPGGATRSGPSYVGVGGNIGFGGDTSIGQGSFSIISKIGLTNNFSVRPAALIEDNATFLVPVTFDFTPTDVGPLGLSPAPYIGGGVAISTGRDDTVGALISGGIDVPISPEFTATAGVNVGFVEGTDVGLLLGVGYNF